MHHLPVQRRVHNNNNNNKGYHSSSLENNSNSDNEDDELEDVLITSNNNNNNNNINNNDDTNSMNNNNLVNRNTASRQNNNNVTNQTTTTSNTSNNSTSRRTTSSNNNSNTLLQIVYLCIKILFYPLIVPWRYLAPILFPAGEFDGLATTTTSSSSSSSSEQRALSHFLRYLKQLQKNQQSRLTDNTNTPAQQPELDSYWNTISLETITNTGSSSAARNNNNNIGTNKLILVYLHSPHHANSDKFCTNFLLSTEMSNFLVSSQDHLCALGISIHSAHGLYLSQILSVTSYPYICLLQPKKLVDNTNNTTTTTSTSSSSSSSNNNNYQLIFKAQGNVLCDPIPSSRQGTSTSTRTLRQYIIQYLQSSVTRFEVMLAEHEARRIQRMEEIELRKQQDYEYQESLRVDRERELAKKEEEERYQREQELAQKALEEKEKIYDTARANLTTKGYYKDTALLLKQQPANTTTNTRIRFVLPGTGTKLDYKFHGENDTIGTLRDFLLIYFKENVKEEIKNIGLSTNFPKQSFNDDDANSKTLKEAGLAPQAVLMVQDLDA